MRSAFSSTDVPSLTGRAWRKSHAVWLTSVLMLPVGPAFGQDRQAGAPADLPCAEVLAALNPGFAARQPDALIAAATLHQSGRCVARNETTATEYLAAAAKAGSRQAALRLARQFGRGRGVPQSYANAGAWVAGKGTSDEAIEPWDYSIGYAYVLLTELLAAVPYPRLAADRSAELAFVIELDATAPTRLTLRRTSIANEADGAVMDALEQALKARLPEVRTWLAAPDARWLVRARVAVPVSVRYTSAATVAQFEGEPVLR